MMLELKTKLAARGRCGRGHSIWPVFEIIELQTFAFAEIEEDSRTWILPSCPKTA
jgi:hypothetical protein